MTRLHGNQNPNDSSHQKTVPQFGTGFFGAYLISMSDQNPDAPEGDSPGQPGVKVVTRPKPETREPALYKVILFNDDFTPMDFVVGVLKRFFTKSDEEARALMMQVHNQGSAVAGTYVFELAETKVFLVSDHARKNKYPLRCGLEKV
jgi:ATP-dependent Clp protease adaptor protein ClpS